MNQGLEVGAARTYDDEIDLMELVVELWRGRWLVAATVLVFLVVAVGYLFVKAPVYHLEARVAQSSAVDLSGLVVLSGGGKVEALFSPEEVFVMVQQVLVSQTARRGFVAAFNKSLVGGREAIDLNWFLGGLKVVAEKKGKAESGVYSVSLDCADEALCADLVNGYVAFVQNKVRESLVLDVLAQLSSEEGRVGSLIDDLMKGHKQAVSDRVIVLDAQIKVARELGWAVPNAEVLVSDKELPRYFEGYKLLEAERVQLLAELESEAYIVGLRQLQQRLGYIEIDRARIASVKGGVSVLNVVDYAYPTGISIAPNKKLVLVLAVMLGGMFGVLGVFVGCGVRSYRAREAQGLQRLAN